MMLSSSGPANIAGNNVSTSIFIAQGLLEPLTSGFSATYRREPIIPLFPPDHHFRIPRNLSPLQVLQLAAFSSTISSVQRSPFFALPASSNERIALIVIP